MTTPETTNEAVGACRTCGCRQLGCACHSTNGLLHTRALVEERGA